MKIRYLLVLLLLTYSFVFTQQKVEISLQKEAEHSISLGLQWLEKNQETDGSWSHYPAVTSLVLVSFLKSPQHFTEENNAAVERGMQFVLGCQKADGGIYVDDLAAYNTAICLLALVAAENPKYTTQIQRARDFLLSLQWDEEKGHEKTDVQYGGVGYSDKERPDLSNLQWAIEALKESEKYKKVSESTGKTHEVSGKSQKQVQVASTEMFWDNALVFIQRCQNLKSTNDQAWAGNDGGFIYSPSESKAGDYSSYGSMTYAGLKSMIYANLDKDDKRVQAAYKWVQQHFTFDENPAMGKQGLFYYYQTAVKALDALGQDVITDTKGNKHEWRKEFLGKIISSQHGEGYWVNENNRWWENQKVLVTSYSLIAMEHSLK